jgi:hypothetical protein
VIKSCRSYIVPTVILCLLSILGGKLLLTPVQELPIRSLFQITYESVRGWPWPYSHSFKTLDATSKIPQQRQATEFFYGSLLADLAVLLTLLTIAALLLRWRYRHRGCWLRFSLGELLTVITLVALACGWASRQHQQWLREQRFIIGDPTADGFDAEIQYQGPEWLRRLWPSDRLTIFNRVVRLTVNDSHPPDESATVLTAAMPDFGYLRLIILHASVAARLVEPAPFSTIEDVYLFPDANTEVVDGALLAISHWPHMRTLTIEVDEHSSFSDRGLAALGQSAALEDLAVVEGQRPHVTDAGIAALARAPRLNSLTLPETKLTDAAMRSFAQMPVLKHLSITSLDNVTDRGIEYLGESTSLVGIVLPSLPRVPDESIRHLLRKIKTVNIVQPGGSIMEIIENP